MGMITEIELEEVQMTGGQKLKGSVYPTISNTLYSSFLVLSDMLFWLYECNSNDMLAGMKARDSVNIWKGWNYHKKVMAKKYKYSNLATSTTKMIYKLVLPESRMLRKYRNRKIQNAATEIFNYMHVGMTRDEASGKDFVGLKGMKDVLEVQEATEDFLLMHVGTGLQIQGQDNVYDVGEEVPDYVELGDLSPTTDLDAITFYEPSAERPDIYIKDAKDTEIPAIKDEVKPSTNV